MQVSSDVSGTFTLTRTNTNIWPARTRRRGIARSSAPERQQHNIMKTTILRFVDALIVLDRYKTSIGIR